LTKGLPQQIKNFHANKLKKYLFGVPYLKICLVFS
jgi:hypothetical protein